MKRAAASSILVSVMLLAVAVIAEAQQPKKVPRIGYLSVFEPAFESTRSEAIGGLCASWAISKDRTSPLSTGMRSRSAIASQRSRPSWSVSRLISSL
jgi:hypothetical protein